MIIRLLFKNGNAFPQGLVTDTIRFINRLNYRLEERTLEEIRREFPDIPQVAVDAALFRLARYEDSAVLVEAAKPGSFEIVVAASALAYWLLDRTVGESLKDAWKTSNLNNRVRGFLLRGQREKSESIASSLSRLNRPYLDRRVRERRVEITTTVSTDGREVVVTIIDQERENLPLTYEEIEHRD
jgi:hypothetical protein